MACTAARAYLRCRAALDTRAANRRAAGHTTDEHDTDKTITDNANAHDTNARARSDFGAATYTASIATNFAADITKHTAHPTTTGGTGGARRAFLHRAEP